MKCTVLCFKTYWTFWFVLALLALNLNAQEQTEIAVHSARPLGQALKELEDRFRVPINYEELIYRDPKDIETVPGRVTRLSKKPYRNPRAARISFAATLNDTPANDRLESALRSAIESYRKEGLPGDYTVVWSADRVSVLPSRSRTEDGKTVAIEPVMGARVRFPYGERTALEALRLIADSVSRSSGHPVRLAAFPWSSEQKVMFGAAGEPAHIELERLMDAMSTKTLSWSLLYDLTTEAYYLSLIPVAPVPTEDREAEMPPVSPSPAKDNPFFTKDVQ